MGLTGFMAFVGAVLGLVVLSTVMARCMYRLIWGKW